MKKLTLSIFTLLLALGLAACSDNDEEGVDFDQAGENVEEMGDDMEEEMEEMGDEMEEETEEMSFEMEEETEEMGGEMEEM